MLHGTTMMEGMEKKDISAGWNRLENRLEEVGEQVGTGWNRLEELGEQVGTGRRTG